MIWSDFETAVLSFMDVDATRRGITPMRNAYIKGAVADLVNYVPAYDSGITTFAPTDETPFDEEVAEAVAEYVKSKITRNVDRDLQISQAHMGSYMLIRRRLFARESAARTPELRPYIGLYFSGILHIRRNKFALPLYGNVWLTVKRYRGDSDVCALFQLTSGAGLTILDVETSQIKYEFSAEQTALLVPWTDEYHWDVLVEDSNYAPFVAMTGLIRPRHPVTQVFTGSTSTIEGNPLYFIGGEPIVFIA